MCYNRLSVIMYAGYTVIKHRNQDMWASGGIVSGTRLRYLFGCILALYPERCSRKSFLAPCRGLVVHSMFLRQSERSLEQTHLGRRRSRYYLPPTVSVLVLISRSQSWSSGNYPLIEHEYDALVLCVVLSLSILVDLRSGQVVLVVQV